MDIVIRIYKNCNLLNLDVAAGAMVGALYFCKLFSVTIHAPDIIALGLTVWVIYTLDRLIDVRNLTNAAASERHKFHQRNQRLLWTLLICIGMVILFLIFYLRSTVLWNGIFLSAIVLMYIVLQKYLKGKEIVVALLYTIGVVLPSWSIRLVEVTEVEYLLVAQLFGVALINLLLFSWFEYETDRQDGHSSMAIRWGKKSTGKFLLILGGINLLISVYLSIRHTFALPTLLLLVMTIILIAIFSFYKFFEINSRYRLLGDAVFIIPLVGILA